MSHQNGAPERPEPPGLSPRASAFFERVTGAYELGDDELEVLIEAVRMMSEIDALADALERDGITVAGSKGQTRVHPAVGEIRQHRMSLARLLKQLDLPAEDEQPESWRTRDARHAANARWGKSG